MTTHQSPRGSLSQTQLDFYEREGYLVLPQLLNDTDMAPPRRAMMEKVAMIADELLADGLVKDKLEHLPFEKRLAALFTNLTDNDFLKYGRSWRDRLPGYYWMM